MTDPARTLLRLANVAALVVVVVWTARRPGPLAPPPAAAPTRAARAPSSPPPVDAECSRLVPPPDPSPRRPALLATAAGTLVARIPVLGAAGESGREAVVRSTYDGWCTLLAAGAPLTFTLDGAWLWFVRGPDAGAAPWLARVPIDGGPVQRVVEVPSVPPSLHLAIGAAFGDDWMVDVPEVITGAPGVRTPPGIVWLPTPDRWHASAAVDDTPSIARIAVARPHPGPTISNLDPWNEMVIVTTLDGFCTLVPPGPPLQMDVAGGWVMFARPDGDAAGARVWIYRVREDGGPIERLARVPFMPEQLRYHEGTLSGSREHARWDRVVGDPALPPGPGTCRGFVR